MTSRILRLALTCAAGGVLACSAAPAAHAADASEPTPLSRAERAAATSVAKGEGLHLAALVAAETGPSTQPSARADARLVTGTTTQVNVLSRDFVATGTGPVGTLGYVANTAAVDGELVTVWSARAKDGSGWAAVNAAAGDVEARYAGRAQGGQVLHEPQINAWYSVKDDRVLPLNDEARAPSVRA